MGFCGDDEPVEYISRDEKTAECSVELVNESIILTQHAVLS
jgi:hypothetical protein